MKMLNLGFTLGTALRVAMLFSTAFSNDTPKYAKETGKKFAESGHKLSSNPCSSRIAKT